MSKLKRYILSIRGETLRYIIAGAGTTFVNFSVFALMTKRLNFAVTISNVAAIVLAIIVAYLLNKFYVFGRRCECRRDLVVEFSKFVGSRICVMGLEIAVVALLVGVLGQRPLAAKVEAQIVVVVVNFFVSKSLVFGG